MKLDRRAHSHWLRCLDKQTIHAQIPTPESNALENPRAVPRSAFVFDLADFRIAATPFAQKSFSILLDTHILGEQDRAEILPLEARLPLRSPSAVS